MTEKRGFLLGALMVIVRPWPWWVAANPGPAKNWRRRTSGGPISYGPGDVENLAGAAATAKLVTTPELKGWIDQKKPMMIIDTMPLEDSYKKQHVPGAVQYRVPHPGS